MTKKILIVLFLMVFLILPVSAWTVTERATFQPAKYQGYLFNNQTVTFDGMTEICAYYGLGPYAVGTTGTGFGYALAPTTYHDLLGTNVTYTPATRPFVSPGALHGVHWDNGDTVNIGTEPTSLSPRWVGQFSFCADGNWGTGKWWITAGEAPNSTIFSISDSADFATKLSGVSINVSNGQSATTDALGTATILIYPPLGTYTYSLTKTGYAGKFLQPLGGYGITGGTVYNTLVAGNGTLPAGYLRTVVHTIDALTGSQISGTTINLRDVENNTWVNSTADADGQLIIDVLESHTLDIYGSYPGVFTASQEIGAVPGGDYYLPMYTALPTPADGYVNVLTYVTSAVDDGPIGSATVTYTYLDGTLKGQKISTVTDNWGASLAVLKNATVVVIDVSKPNYNGQSASHTLPNFVDVMYTFRLSKGGMITAVPTVTDPATGAVITAVPTYLPYCDPSRGDYDEALCGHSKDNALFGQLRESGSAIIGLCILAIIFGLLKMIMKF